jgi:methionyl-tRNA formyltransferase
VDQQTVPILPDDTAAEVFNKVTVAAEMVLARSLPGLVAGSAPRRPLDLKSGSYFGRRRAEDGRIDWSRPAKQVHDLIRAVAPPYPGAFSSCDGSLLRVLRSHYAGEAARYGSARLYAEAGRWQADCGDGRRLEILQLELDGRDLDAAHFAQLHGDAALPLGE